MEEETSISRLIGLFLETIQYLKKFALSSILLMLKARIETA